MTDDRASLRVAFIGWGAIARTAAEMLTDDPVAIVAVAIRDKSAARTGVPREAALIDAPDELADTRPDLVAEVAGREAVEPWGLVALRAGADYVVSSVSAFADPAVLESLRDRARWPAGRIHISPGALAGVEALSAARSLGIDTVDHHIVKPPAAWRGTPAETACDLDALTAPITFFRGDAAETAERFPKNANVAMTTALAGIGPEATVISLVADPASSTNRHEITASGAFGRLEVSIANNPLPANPRTSAMAALSLVRAIRNRTTAIVI